VHTLFVCLSFYLLVFELALAEELNLRLSSLQNVVVIGDRLSTGFGFATPWSEHFTETFGVALVNAAAKNKETLCGAKLMSGVLEKEKPSHVIIMGTLPPIHGHPWMDQQAQMISDCVPFLTGAQVADIRARFGQDSSLYADFMHPNQERISEVFLSLFEEPLKT